MKALTVKQPWAWALIHGGKDVENRSRPTKHRGQLFIHAGKGWADEGVDAIGIEGMPADDELLSGMVIGAVDVIDCHHATECQNWAESGSLCTEWAMPDHFHWVLKKAQSITPFPAQGKLGIWKLAAL